MALAINNTANDESGKINAQRDSLVGRGKSASSCRSAVIYVARHPRRMYRHILRDYLRILADLSPLYRQLCLC